MLFIEKYIPQLSAMYSEPHRDYHSLTHIHGLYRIILSGSWQGLLQKKSDATSGNTQAISRKLSFIAWFHDCYYDPYLGSPKNEQMSADIFQAMVLPDATYSGASSFMDSVYEGIMLTSRHLSQLEVGCHDFEHLLFMDLDMLGFAYKDEFLRNNVSVRNEYYKTSDVEYLTNREAARKLRPLGAVAQQSEQRHTVTINTVDLFADMIYNPEKQSRISK